MPKPFLTPEFTSEEWQCRTLRTPNNKEWLGVFTSALEEMTNPYNWEQVETSDLTIEQAIAIVQGILIEFYSTETCLTGCSLPDLDSPPFRLGVNGRFEMLDPETGEWGEPTGEYEIPPTPPREEATAEERRCAAAANAAHVMGLLYEAITDEIALGGDALQIAAAMVAALVTAVGGWIAAPVYAIIQLTIALFVGMIELLQALGADVWTEGYQEHLKCVLYNCSTDTGDVVTFDLDCIRENLYEGLDLLDPDFFYDAQIYAQVLFLLETITMDGLNAAGATTAITGADCEVCELEWSACFDFVVEDGGWTTSPCYTFTVYDAGEGWGRTGRGIVAINRDFAPTKITSFGIELDQPLTGNYHRMFYKQDGDICDGGSTEVNIGASTEWGIFGLTGTTTSLQILFQNNTPDTSNPLDYHIIKVNVNGIGYNPFEDYPPCV